MIRAAGWKPEFRSARRREMPVPVWWQRIQRRLCAPEMYLPEHPCLQWWFWKKTYKAVHEELDMVTTPAGDAGGDGALQQLYLGSERLGRVCFGNLRRTSECNVDMNELFGKLYNKALEGDKDCGGLAGIQLFLRRAGYRIRGGTGRCLCASRMHSLISQTFMRTHLYAALGNLKDRSGYSAEGRKSKGGPHLRTRRTLSRPRASDREFWQQRWMRRWQ